MHPVRSWPIRAAYFHAALALIFSACMCGGVSGQTLFAPGGTVGNNTTNSNVGVGTTSPSDKLTVNGDIRIHTEPDGQAIKLNGRASDGFSQLAFYNNAGSAFTGLLQYHGDGTIVFVNTSALAERMRVSHDGNVGIGTNTPIRALTIGHASSAEMVFQNAGRPADQRNYRIYSSNGGLIFGTLNDAGNAGANHLVIDQASGNVGISTTNPTHKLAVNGSIRAKEVVVETTGWSDYVFAKDYRLAPLSEVEQHIQQNGHLPDVPSAADVAARGVSVGEMQKILLQKIEELTLHAIEQEKFTQEQMTRLEKQASRLSKLEAENAQLRQQLSDHALRSVNP